MIGSRMNDTCEHRADLAGAPTPTILAGACA